MSARIGSNISSLQAQRRLGEATSALQKSFERLSSGQRINRAADDAAGLAIAKTLDAKARIFGQGVRNLNDGISYNTVAGGALRELKSILLRQRELSTQSANGTYSDQQRKALEVELRELSAEWNRVLDSTTFNGRKVFSAREGHLSLQAGVGSEAVLHAAFGSPEAAAQDDIRRMSLAADGTEAQGDSLSRPAISADGRYVAFSSAASNLVTGDTNAATDVFIRDLTTGEVKRVSTSSTLAQAAGGSNQPALSADGRYVAFTSAAGNLVSGDTNGKTDVFIKDLRSGETRRISTVSGGDSDDASSGPAISADGRYVSFLSRAENLVPDDTNGCQDVFVRDLQTGMTSRVSTDDSGSEADADSAWASISADGRYVAFASGAGNLVAGDSNGADDIFIKDLSTGAITRVSTSSSGVQGDGDSSAPFISADGRYVAYSSAAANLVAGDGNMTDDIFIKDLQSGMTTRASTGSNGTEADGDSYAGGLSADGRYLTFSSFASNLVAGETSPPQVYVKDMRTGDIAKISVNTGGTEGDWDSMAPAMSADGRYVAFNSEASNLVPDDSGNYYDHFATGNPLVEWSVVSRNQWLSVSSRAEALLSQGRIDNYLTELNTVEGTLGAVEARLGTALSNLASMIETFRSAESRILDADIGQETAELARTRIVQEAAAAILAQANAQPQLALRLLSPDL